MAKPFRKPDSRNYYIEVWSHGHRRTLSLGTDNYGIAKAMAGRLEHEVATTGLRVQTQTEVAVVVPRFIQHLHTHLRFKTAETDIGRLLEFFGTLDRNAGPGAFRRVPRSPRRPGIDRHRFAVKARYVEEITTARVLEFLTKITAERKLAPKTWNEYRGVLLRFFSWAMRTQGMNLAQGLNPVAAVTARRVDPPTIRFLTLPQIHEQLQALEAHLQLLAMVATYIYAGLRREELLWLTPRDVDLQTRMIHVRAKTVDGRSWRPKTNKNRRIPISEALWRHLKDYEPSGDRIWYFPAPCGGWWDPDNFSAKLREINARCGLDWSCADYRHSFGTQMAVAGRDERTIAELMGNSPTIVRRHYAAWLPEAHPEAVEFDLPSGPQKMAGTRDANFRVEAHRRGLRLVNDPA